MAITRPHASKSQGISFCEIKTICEEVAAKIEQMPSNTVHPGNASCPEFPSENEILSHCVRLAHSQLGIDVTGLDLKGELDSNKFKYLKICSVTGGFTNILYKVTNSKNNKTVAVRIFGRKTERFIDRSHERIIQTHLCIQGFAKHVYARFNGGQVEEWLQGEVLSDEEFYGFKYNHLIAKQLRVLHNIPGQRELYLRLHPEVRKETLVNFESQLWPSVWRFYNLCIENISLLKPIIGDQFNLYDIRGHLERIHIYCDEVNSPVVLCHGDLSKGNIVLNSSNDVLFLDYEYACFMERAFDMAAHFSEFAAYESDSSRIPSSRVQHEFIRHYLGEEATEDEVEYLFKEIQPFLIVPNIYWGLWGLLQCVYSSIHTDFAHYSMNRITRFLDDVKTYAQH
ncbi:choline ethanolamine [Babesia ovis]|uniref:ethanolamine kinase n=1 Tax=Babesia ovis TaxID=5869 RepID=A0A9W5T9J6_BABOV|nr:choline ethanolamine [Babesia ovis]